jgi:hypothetical protein
VGSTENNNSAEPVWKTQLSVSLEIAWNTLILYADVGGTVSHYSGSLDSRLRPINLVDLASRILSDTFHITLPDAIPKILPEIQFTGLSADIVPDQSYRFTATGSAVIHNPFPIGSPDLIKLSNYSLFLNYQKPPPPPADSSGSGTPVRPATTAGTILLMQANVVLAIA